MYGRVPLFPAPSSFQGSGRRQDCPADNPDEHNTEENTDAVDAHIPQGWSAPGNKGLMVFIGEGKTYTYDACDQEQRKAPEPIDVEGKGYSDGQDEIFGHMSDFSDRAFNSLGVGINLPIVQFFVQNEPSGFYNLIADFVAQLPGIYACLGGERKNEHHHCQCGEK